VPDLEYQPFEERLHKEIRRRREVVGIFQGRASDICLVGSLLIGETEEWAERCSMSARGPCQGPPGTVPRRRPRHGTRPPGVADGERIEGGSRGGHYTTSPDVTNRGHVHGRGVLSRAVAGLEEVLAERRPPCDPY